MPTKPELGKPYLIDGVEITLSNPRIGGETDNTPEKDAPPEDQFYKLTFKFRNASNKTVIAVEPWAKTMLKDEHGKFYKSEYLEGRHGSKKLRPGAESFGVVYFKVPPPNAKDLILIAEPAFYRDRGDVTLREISKLSGEWKVPNPAAKP